MAHPLLTDAGGRPISALPGACTFDSAMSFGLIAVDTWTTEGNLACPGGLADQGPHQHCRGGGRPARWLGGQLSYGDRDRGAVNARPASPS